MLSKSGEKYGKQVYLIKHRHETFYLTYRTLCPRALYHFVSGSWPNTSHQTAYRNGDRRPQVRISGECTITTCKATSPQKAKILSPSLYNLTGKRVELVLYTPPPPRTNELMVPVQPHPTTSRHFDSFQRFSAHSLCFIANSTYLPFPHFAHNWHSLSSAALGGFLFLVDSVPYLSHWAFGPRVNLYFLPGPDRLTWP